MTPAERQAFKRVRGRRLRALLVCVGTGALTLFAAGCPEPADLQDPASFPLPPNAGSSSTTGGSGTGGSGTGGTGMATCEVECVNKIFMKDMQPCMFCHTTMAPLGDLDLQSPGYTARLKDVPAKHTGFMGPTTDCPQGDKLIDTTTPANSWLLKKLHNEQKTCGTLMPQAGTITPDQKTCLETYVACVASSGAAAGTAGSAAATGGTATGGSGGTGGT